MALGKRRPARSPGEGRRGAKHQVAEVAGREASETLDALEVLRLSHDGRGVARDAEGKTVFIDRALPGERVEVRRHRQRRRFDEAHPVQVSRPSPVRVVPECVHFDVCGGCSLQHLDIGAQREHKAGVLVEHLHRVRLDVPAVELLAGEAYGYRRRARLGVKLDGEGRLRFGFRRRQSERLFDIEQCPVLLPGLEVLLAPLRECLERLEAPRQLGHIELIAGDDAVALKLRQLKPVAADESRWRTFAEAHDLALVFDRGEPSALPTLHYRLDVGGRSLALGFQPGDFLQVNGAVNQQLVGAALDWLGLPVGARLLDLFAGVGNFGLPFAATGVRVAAIEGSAAMAERVSANARTLELEITARAMDLSQAPGVEDIDAVLLDPPRDGAQNVCKALASAGPERVLYVSCDPATLARDAALLVAGGYRLVRIALVDMFPQTPHLESLSLFERR
ncbi:23S rRNA (uracil(1939)-C(5))-methyltransferase [Halotalea alkalilenta]|uniref:23S rRNA (uracil(1939)-C(5))-methyltransferase n=1 Tax=Halotalea alkalilenta TaxID=376489 RepID=UPI0004852108|nr:23S rRNA (uracil(1939)-C(5))-methyltransferase [Halotalea alkalilenta]